MTPRRNLQLAFSLLLPAFALHAQSPAAQAVTSVAKAIPIPGGEVGIGFDDLRYSPSLKRFLVPAGQTGRLALLDPATRQITALGPFGAAAGAKYGGGHGEGVTSADSGAGFLFVADRNSKQIHLVDAGKGTLLSSVKLAGNPDYVRFLEPAREVWVTEPGAKQIEIFKLNSTNPPALAPAGFIAVPGGPEAFVYDAKSGRAYTHLWKGKTAVLDWRTHKLLALWVNGCEGSRGIALDETRGFLFAGCDEGRATILDVAHDGKILGQSKTEAGVDIIDYNPRLGHLYVPSESGFLEIFAVSAEGTLRALAHLPAAKEGHCVAADDHGNLIVCDPGHGRVLAFRDDPAPAEH